MTAVKDLMLADDVLLGSGPYMTATVHQITEDSVILWRPYMQAADFKYTGGVILTIGLEIVTLPKNDSRSVELVKRSLKGLD